MEKKNQPMRTLTSDLTGSFDVVLEQSWDLSIKPETAKHLESVSWTKIFKIPDEDYSEQNENIDFKSSHVTRVHA